MSDDSGWAESTEEEHDHLCGTCGDVWSHQDDACEGPRFESYRGPAFECPMCVERGED
jgi:hypothetical protein